MSDLISRQAAIDEIDKNRQHLLSIGMNGDVPDRKVGKWMAEPNCWYRCSNCGQHYPSIRGYMDYNYCPNCGAKMERSEE